MIQISFKNIKDEDTEELEFHLSRADIQDAIDRKREINGHINL